MRIKELFTVAEGNKVTEKILARVLISSICSMLLCMACLAGTTWAWFVVGFDAAESVIEIATVDADVTVTNDIGTPITAQNDNYDLQTGMYTMQIKLSSNAARDSSLESTGSPVYVLMSVKYGEQTLYRYFTVEAGKTETAGQLKIESGTATVSFSVSWVRPASATEIGSEVVVIGTVPAPQTETTVPAAENTTAQ